MPRDPRRINVRRGQSDTGIVAVSKREGVDSTSNGRVSAFPDTVLLAVGEALECARLAADLAERGLAIVAEVVDARAAIAAAERERPDLCLIDLDLTGGGPAAVAQIAMRVPATIVIALVAAADPEQMIAALERGASGYVLKSTGPDELAKSLRAAHAGEPALARGFVPHLIASVRNGASRRAALPTLTPREWDVAELLQAGLQTDEIALRLGLSAVTVRRHISALMRKSGAGSRAALAEILGFAPD